MFHRVALMIAVGVAAYASSGGGLSGAAGPVALGAISGATPTVMVDPSSTVVGRGDSVAVDVRVNLQHATLQRWKLRLKFDPATVTAAACEFADDPSNLRSVCNEAYSPDSVSIVGYKDPAATNDGLLARVRFAATGDSGTATSLDIEVVEFTDASGDPVPVSSSSGAISIQGTGTHAIIRGTVFEDTNEDGVMGAGDSGLFFREVTAISAPYTEAQDTTSQDGAYIIDRLTTGTHQVLTELDSLLVPGCPTDQPPTFSPLGVPVCPGQRELFEPTTPEVREEAVTSGSVTTVDFGGRRLDIRDTGGQAILRDNYAPAGTTIQAVANGVVCGSASVRANTAAGVYEMAVLGAPERPGCAAEGETVRFTLGGLVANQAIWEDNSQLGRVDVVAMPDHAWYWLQQPAEANVELLGVKVEALVTGTVCGSTKLEQASGGLSPLPGPLGFARLIVPRDSLEQGCGTEGAVVSFQIGGVEFATAEWATGVHKLGAEALPMVGPTELPKTGGARTPESARSRSR